VKSLKRWSDLGRVCERSKQVRADRKPEGPIEGALVQLITTDIWRLQRVTRIEAEILRAGALDKVISTAQREARLWEGPFHARKALSAIAQEALDEALLKEERAEQQRDQAVLGHAFSSGANAIGTLTRYEVSLKRSLHKNLQELHRLQEARRDKETARSK